jgi:hypothetical protein
MDPNRIELPDLGEIAVITSNFDDDLCVSIGTTNDECCITDPFSSTCGRFKADPITEYGLTKEQVRKWWEAVKDLREDDTYSEASHNAPDDHVESWLATH